MLIQRNEANFNPYIAERIANDPIYATDLLERPVEAPGVAVGQDAAELVLRPFQLVTLRFAR